MPRSQRFHSTMEKKLSIAIWSVQLFWLSQLFPATRAPAYLLISREADLSRFPTAVAFEMNDSIGINDPFHELSLLALSHFSALPFRSFVQMRCLDAILSGIRFLVWDTVDTWPSSYSSPSASRLSCLQVFPIATTDLTTRPRMRPGGRSRVPASSFHSSDLLLIWNFCYIPPLVLLGCPKNW